VNTSAPAAPSVGNTSGVGAVGARALRWAAWCGAGLACALLVGCAVPAREALGTLRADVANRLGKPTAVYPRPEGGERWQYSELPAGVQVYNLDFDTTGRLVRNAPALTQQWLQQIPVGQWTVADVRYWLGLPQRVERVALFEGEVWTYRFTQLSDPRLAYIHIDPSGTVRRVLFADDIPNTQDDRP
jgi:hypothetical protein